MFFPVPSVVNFKTSPHLACQNEQIRSGYSSKFSSRIPLFKVLSSLSRKTYVGPALCETWQYDTFILEDIPVIPDLEDVQEEDMMTQIAAPPRCVIDMFHLEPFSISGLLSLREKNSPSSINLCPVVGLVRITPEEFENESFTLKTHQMFSVHTMR